MEGAVRYVVEGGVAPGKSSATTQNYSCQRLSSCVATEQSSIKVGGGLPCTLVSKRGNPFARKQNPLATVRLGGALRRRSSDGLGGSGVFEKSRVKLSVCGASGSHANEVAGSLQNEQFSSTGTAFPSPTSAVSKLRITEQHIFLLTFFACAMTAAVSCFLLVAIPTLRSWRRAAVAISKLADAAREELPGTMAAVRLSGMEISDLTMELSDLGQEISSGVRSSSRAVRIAEAGLRRLGSVTTSVAVQGTAEGREKLEAVKPSVARAAKGTREALVQSRSLLRSLVTLTRLSAWFGRWWTFVRPFQRKSVPSRPLNPPPRAS